MRTALRIVCISLPTWAFRLAIFLPLAVIGVPLVYVLAHSGWCVPRHSPRFNRTVLQWRTLWLFGPWNNEEDGVDGLRGGDPAQSWWAQSTANLSPQMRIWRWAAIRNPVDNLRFVPILNPKIDPKRVRFVGLDHEPVKGEGGWYYAWMGAYSCIRYETRRWRFWLGTKLKPEDRLGIADSDPRRIRADFALQLKRIA
jgi:hypothetical protein